MKVKRLEMLVTEFLDQCSSLEDYAALAAFKVLATNWDDAIHDGASIKGLVHDLDDVCAELKNLKEYILKLEQADART